MNLGELSIAISADTSAINALKTAFSDAASSAESAANRMQRAFDGIDASKSAGRSANSIGEIDNSLTKAVASGELFASALEKAFDAVTSAAQKVASALGNMVSQSVGAFADFQQGSQALEDTFGTSSQNFINWAKENSAQYGISVNEIVNNAVEMGTILNKANAQQRVAAEQGEQQTTDMIKEQNAERLLDLKQSMSAQLDEVRSAQQREYTAWSNYYSDVIDNLRRSLSDELDELRDSLDDQLKERQKAYAKELSEKQAALDAIYTATRRALEDEVDAFNRATDQRIKEINREYTERYKLIDEEKYEQLKAIQDEIDAMDEQKEQEKRSSDELKYIRKKSDLEYKMATADSAEEIADISEDLADLETSNETRKNNYIREDRKKSLREQMDDIRDYYDGMKDELKEQQEDEIEEYKLGRSDELKELRRSNEDKLAQLKADQNKELEAIRERQSKELEELRESHSDILKEKQRANEDILKAQQRWNSEQLQNLRDAQSAELKSIQDHNSRVLEEQKRAMKKQEKEAKSGGMYAKVTQEDMDQSMMSMETMIKAAADIGARRNMPTSDVLGILNSVNYGRYATFDNLGLGYANKTGMQQLVADMNAKLESQGETGDLDVDNFNDIIKAIDLLVDDLGIAGLASKEAEDTFSGSLNALKSQWGNFLLSLSVENGELIPDEELDKLLEKLDTFIDNAMPVVTRIIDAIIGIIIERGPEIVDTIKTSIMEHLPDEWKQKIEDFKTTFNTILGTVEAVAAGIGALTVAGGIVDLITLFNTISTTVVPALTTALGAGGLSGVVSGASAFFGDLGAAVQLLVEPFTAATASGVVPFSESLTTLAGTGGIIGLVVAAIAGMVANSESLRGLLGDMAGTVGGVLVDAFKALQPLLELVQGLWDRLNQGLGVLGDTVANTFGPAWETLKEAFGPVIQEHIQKIQDIFTSVKDIVLGICDAVGNVLKPIIEMLAPILAPIFDAISGFVGGALATLFDIVVNTVLLGTIQSFLDMLKTIGDVLGPAFESLGGFLNDVKNRVQETADSIHDKMKEVTEFFGNVQKEIESFFKDPIGWLKEKGKEIVQGLLNGMKEIGENVKDFFKDLPGNIMSTLEDQFVIKSPSHKMKDIGENVMEGFNEGASGNPWSGVSDFFTNMPNNLIDAIGEVDNLLGGKGEDIINGFMNGIEAVRDGLFNWFEDLPDAISDAIGDLSGLLTNAGRDVINGFWDGLVDTFDNVKDWVWSIGDWIQANKGPKQYDLGLLVSNGQWIMQSLEAGMRSAFPLIEDAVSDISDMMTIDVPKLDMGVMMPTATAGARDERRSLPPINLYMTYNAGDDARAFVTDMVGELRRYGYTMGGHR